MIANEKEFEDRFWKSIRSDMTVMIGAAGVRRSAR